MNVVFCSSEVFPFAKTGGLADVSGALPQALARKGCTVKVFQPLYKNIKPEKLYDDYGLTRLGGVDFYFIKNDEYYLREGIYGTPKGDYPDNLERFSFFSKQVLEVLKKINFSPQIINCNDWQTSMVNIYLKLLYSKEPLFAKTKTILTIHNLAYQGLFVREKYPYLGISKQYFTPQYLEFYDKVSLLKGGIIFSDLVTTVSPTYAREIKTPAFGCGLEGVLKEKGKDVVGILNAIDYDVWDPAKDDYLYKRYSPNNLADKAVNKTALQKELGLKVDQEAFLLSMVSRLAEQKGLDILSEGLDEILGKYQVVILGFGEECYHTMLGAKADKFKDSFSLNLKFDESLAHKIYGASDAFLMPSRFEPCGLSQMISYKYATVPIANHTGGLADTVIDVVGGGGGFVFNNYSASDLLLTLERAQSLFKNKSQWQEILEKIVNYNFSWEVAAGHYLDVYKSLST
ncbi:MAG: glycogen synthase [Candidatus Omnitrophica bacterium]|nr:glycogen synthase [Candidatus Omnitrophota bacterium]MBU2473785.1 glycogen synthase [Candidatus Omnitrophota bacterium]